MAKVLVLCYPNRSRVETVAGAVAEGGRSAGAAMDVQRVPDLMPDEAAHSSRHRLNQVAAKLAG